MWEINDLNFDNTIVTLEMPDLLQVIIVWAVDLMRGDAAEIFLWDETRGHLIQSIGFGRMAAYIGLTVKPGEGIVGKVYETGQPMIVPDYASFPSRLDAYHLESAVTDIAVPMKWNERIIGVLGITADPKQRSFDEEDFHTATLFANLAALTIHNHRLYNALQDRAERLEIILEREVAERTTQLAYRALQLETSARVSRQITSILDTETLATSVVELISQAFDYPSVLIYLFDEQTNTLVLRANTGAVVDDQFRKLQIDDKSLNGTAAQTNQPVLVRWAGCDPDNATGHNANPDIHSELVIPLHMGPRILGTLNVHSKRKDDFNEEDIRLLQSLSDQIAIAVENAHLYDQSHRLAALEERSNLARELHDSATQLLFSITLNAETARMLLARVEHQTQTHTVLFNVLTRLQTQAHQAMNEMRTLVHQIRPGPEPERSFLVLLRDYVNEREKYDSLKVELHIEEWRKLPVRYELALFRVIQEALNNIIKHARTNIAKITLRFEGEKILLLIEDQGCGFDCRTLFDQAGTARYTGGRLPTLGLTSMRERVELLGGTFEIKSCPGSGTCIRVQVPTVQEGKKL